MAGPVTRVDSDSDSIAAAEAQMRSPRAERIQERLDCIHMNSIQVTVKTNQRQMVLSETRVKHRCRQLSSLCSLPPSSL
jgi:hypothetical protein